MTEILGPFIRQFFNFFHVFPLKKSPNMFTVKILERGGAKSIFSLIFLRINCENLFLLTRFWIQRENHFFCAHMVLEKSGIWKRPKVLGISLILRLFIVIFQAFRWKNHMIFPNRLMRVWHFKAWRHTYALPPPREFMISTSIFWDLRAHIKNKITLAR